MFRNAELQIKNFEHRKRTRPETSQPSPRREETKSLRERARWDIAALRYLPTWRSFAGRGFSDCRLCHKANKSKGTGTMARGKGECMLCQFGGSWGEVGFLLYSIILIYSFDGANNWLHMSHIARITLKLQNMNWWVFIWMKHCTCFRHRILSKDCTGMQVEPLNV